MITSSVFNVVQEQEVLILSIALEKTLASQDTLAMVLHAKAVVTHKVGELDSAIVSAKTTVKDNDGDIQRNLLIRSTQCPTSMMHPPKIQRNLSKPGETHE